MEYTSKSTQETIEIAKKYAKTLNKGDVVILDGEMGAGKTAAKAIDEAIRAKA